MRQSNIGGPNKSAEIVRQYIHRNYAKNMTLDAMASVASMNRTYLIDVFKAHAGMTPMEYVTRCRIERAKQLLRETDDKLIWVGMDVGFGSEVSFYRSFKRFTGMTPGMYRQEWSAKSEMH